VQPDATSLRPAAIAADRDIDWPFPR